MDKKKIKLMEIISRFAPSPTGFLHIGGARTAVFAWLYAKSQGGKCLLRLEDTDKARSNNEFTKAIIDDLKWLGVDFDEEPIFQSKNRETHLNAINSLLETGSAYYCKCSHERLDSLRKDQQRKGIKPKYDGRCRNKSLDRELNYVVRFKNPSDGYVTFQDIVRGNITTSNKELDDLILLRGDQTPTYNLSVVVDDIKMGITHVLRGDDHINNTPRQINIFESLNASVPAYGHVPMILGDDGKRMSKRESAVSLAEYKELGILPQALLNYLVRLGWSLGDKEIFDIYQLIENFKEGNFNRSPAKFSLKKLTWFNKEYLHKLENKELIRSLSGFNHHFSETDEFSIKVLELIKDRCITLKDFEEKSSYFFEDIEIYDPILVKKIFTEDAIRILTSLVNSFQEMKVWDSSSVLKVIESVMAQYDLGMGQVGKPLRFALTGITDTPAIGDTASLIGREKSILGD